MEQTLPKQQQQDPSAEEGGSAASARPPLFFDIRATVGWFSINMAARGYNGAAFEGVE